MANVVKFEARGGPYAFKEPVEIWVVGRGPKAYLWMGLKNGSCLGVLEGKRLGELGRVIRERMIAPEKTRGWGS